MKTQTLTEMGAAELAQAIRARQASAREVVEAHIRRIEAVNNRLNAVVVSLFDEALRQADAADAQLAAGEAAGPLHGVPVTVKEQFRVAGTDATLGLRRLVGNTSESDGPLVARLRRAGAIVLGKTNVPQLMLAYESDSDVYGRTNNPWDLDRTAGGSTGGEAAIIAARGSPLGLGSDTAGSIRVPAHFCGIHGLKPTSRRLTGQDTPAHLVGGFAGQEAVVSQPGPMARRVVDLELAMRVLTTPDGDRADPTPPVPWSAGEVSMEGLRVGMYEDDGFFAPAPAVARAVREAAEALGSRGAEVEPFVPPDVGRAVGLFLALVSSGGRRSLKRALGGDRLHPLLGQIGLSLAIPNPMRPVVARLAELFGHDLVALMIRSMGGRSTHNFWALTLERDAYQAAFLQAMGRDRLDAIVCPPFAVPAPLHATTQHLFPAASYAMLYNLLGLPAGVVAATRVRPGEESGRAAGGDIGRRTAARVEKGSTGLPVGVQVVARPWREDVVLAVMAALEEHFLTTPDYPGQPL